METKLNLATSTKKSHSILTIKGRKQSARSEKKTSPLAIAAIVLKTKQQLRPWANNFWPSEQQKLPCASNIITTTSSGQPREKAERAIQRQVTPVGSVGSVGFGRFGSTALSRASRELDAHRLGQTQLVPEAQFQTSAICLSDQ